MLMNSPVSALPLGEQADTFARIVRNERKGEAHFPVPVNQIDISRWKAQAKKQRSQTQRIMDLIFRILYVIIHPTNELLRLSMCLPHPKPSNSAPNFVPL